MTRKPRSAKHRHAEFIKVDLESQVRMATPLARELVTLGLCDVADVCTPENMALANHVEDLIGHAGPPVADDDLHQISEALAAAYALGIAIGLLLRPDAFTGGAR